MSDRGIKKWAPYKSLVEQYESIENVTDKQKQTERPILSEEDEEEINQILINYNGEPLIARIFKNNRIIEEEIIINKIDVVEKKLILNDRRAILLADLVGLQKVK